MNRYERRSEPNRKSEADMGFDVRVRGRRSRVVDSQGRAGYPVQSNEDLQRALLEEGIRPKLTVSDPDDEYEKEAERVADAVMSMGDPANEFGAFHTPAEGAVSRMCTRCRRRHEQGKPLDCEECENDLMRQEDVGGKTPTVDAEVEQGIRSVQSGGRPLPKSTRSFFEPRFGRDLSHVRVHTGSYADTAAKSIDAEAFAVGSDVAFAAGKYRPHSRRGRALLAHELTHVVQQDQVARKRIHRNDEEECGGKSGSGAGISAGIQDCSSEKAAMIKKAHRRASSVTLSAALFVKDLADKAAASKDLDELESKMSERQLGRMYIRWSLPVASYIREDIGPDGQFSKDDFVTDVSIEAVTDAFRTISRNYYIIHKGLDAGDFSYECESTCDTGTDAYVWLGTAKTGWGSIHLCPTDIWDDTYDLSDTIIHEALHRFVGSTTHEPKSLENPYDYVSYATSGIAPRLEVPEPSDTRK